MNSIRKSEKKILIIGLIVVLVAIISTVSYAIWMRTFEQTERNLVETGCFTLAFNDGDAITLSNTFPLTVEAGMKLDPYTFTLENTCGVTAEYQINLEILDTTTMDPRYVYHALNNYSRSLSVKELVEPTIANATVAYKLKNNILGTGETVTYDLRLWIDEDAEQSEVNLTKFESKVTIVATPTLKEPLGVDLLWLGGEDDTILGVVSETDGYVTIGSDWYSSKIKKYDTLGNIVWDTEYAVEQRNIFSSIIVVDDGYIIVGATDKPFADVTTPKGLADGVIVKYNKSGTLVWNRHFGGSSNDYFYSVVETTDGYVVVGYSTSVDGDIDDNLGNADAIIVKYDKSGNVVWNKNFGGNSFDMFNSITKVSDGYIVTGSWVSDNEDLINDSGGSEAIFKLDETGNIIWSNSGAGAERFNSVIEIDDGYIVAGVKNPDTNDRGIILKYDKSGNLIWNKVYDSENRLTFYTIIKLDDYFIVTGHVGERYKDLHSPERVHTNGIFVKYDASGTVINSETFGDIYEDKFLCSILVNNVMVVVGTRDQQIG